MDHGQLHRPGTVTRCPECHGTAYEPGWYATLVAFSDVDLTVQEEADALVRA